MPLTGRGIRKAARAAARAGDWPTAAALYRRLVGRGGALLRDRIQLAHALKEAGDEAGALAAYSAAIAAAPLSADTHRELSLFLHRLGETDAALDALLRGWVADPAAIDLDAELDRLGVDRGALDRYVQVALAGADPPPAMPPGRVIEWRRAAPLRRARRAARRGDWAEAERGYRAVLAVDPRATGARVQLGHMLAEQGRGEAALAAYRTALLLTPGDADLHCQVGHALKRLDRLAAAFGAYLTAWRLHPGDDAVAAELVALNPGLTAARLRADAAGLLLLTGADGAGRLPMPADLAPPYTLYYRALAGALGV